MCAQHRTSERATKRYTEHSAILASSRRCECVRTVFHLVVAGARVHGRTTYKREVKQFRELRVLRDQKKEKATSDLYSAVRKVRNFPPQSVLRISFLERRVCVCPVWIVSLEKPFSLGRGRKGGSFLLLSLHFTS